MSSSSVALSALNNLALGAFLLGTLWLGLWFARRNRRTTDCFSAGQLAGLFSHSGLPGKRQPWLRYSNPYSIKREASRRGAKWARASSTLVSI
jgi:hypothetical protein